MICLVVSQSRFCVVTIVFYTCVWIPLLQLKKALLGLVRNIMFFTCENDQPFLESNRSTSSSHVNSAVQPWLPISRYVDLKLGQCGDGESPRNDVVCGHDEAEKDQEEPCSICLVEFEKEDVVSQLSKCGHVFHIKCIERWLDSNHFTCPLCRSSFLHDTNPNSHAKIPLFSPLSDFNPYTSSYLGYSWH
ncbi:RING-H2 finger protein ATL18 [Humulus lupulus]|uniref:RING-H2 finger protein ATL18 n=1 Tax=Humulus lupulus TaxID=3486 RepID=UPI002B41307A|nr:RING-H2 finger protein ATL18 [Humulus lupulus]